MTKPPSAEERADELADVWAWGEQENRAAKALAAAIRAAKSAARADMRARAIAAAEAVIAKAGPALLVAPHTVLAGIVEAIKALPISPEDKP